jgi:hypothetical protein
MSDMATGILNRHRQAAADFANRHAAPVAICRRPPGEFGLSEQPYLNLFLDDVGKLFASGGIDTVIEIVYPAKDGIAGRVVDIEETQKRINQAIQSHLTPDQAEELRRYFVSDGRTSDRDLHEAQQTAEALRALTHGGLGLDAFLELKPQDGEQAIDPEILRKLRKTTRSTSVAE